MRLRPQSTLVRWSLPAATVALAVVLRIALRDAMGGVPPFLLFFAAVMAAAALGGLGPGILATALAAAAINFFLIPPFYQFVVPTRGEVIELFMFCAEGVFISVLSGLLHEAVRRAQASEREARGLERRVLEVGDAERRRVGHDLHDGLGQQLLGAAFMGKTLQNKLSDAGSPQAVPAAEIVGAINEALSFTRDLARSLSAFAVSRSDFPTLLADLAVGTEKMFGVKCSFHHDDGIVLPEGNTAEHLYRLAQEAVNNAVKHGKASHIDIIWQSCPTGQVLWIRDNGVGFDPDAGTSNGSGGGIGLRVMQYRAELIGGRLRVDRGHIGGTVVACEFPTGTTT
jgi:signal transduction histidine kinase